MSAPPEVLSHTTDAADGAAAVPGGVPTRQASHRRGPWAGVLRERRAVAGTALLLLLVVLCVSAPLWTTPPDTIDLTAADRPPSAEHPFGTDQLGRDLLARSMAGGRLTLAVGFSAMAAAVLLGVVVGALAGAGPRWVDAGLMRGVDVFYAVPGLFLVILVMSLWGATFVTIVLSIALLSWMTVARLTRATYLSVRERDFVRAARLLGFGRVRVAVLHVLPNTLGPVLVAATLGVASAILLESALSFLGLGFSPPTATWGGMLQDAIGPTVQQGLWWQGFFPGALIALTVLAVTWVGDGLRAVVDPRSAA
jgi:peptide/nickel transport system permease protein